MQTPGTVKSFNGRFGFLTSEEVEGDVMFTPKDLPEDAREVPATALLGRPVHFDWVQGPDGRAKATAVSLPPVDGFPLPGRIKCFLEAKGYGFVTSSSVEGLDARFEADRLPPLPPGAQLNGQLVTFEPNYLPNGMIRVANLAFQRDTAGAQGGAQMAPQAGGKGAGAGKPSGDVRTGQVKNFREASGYGFIVCPGMAGDLKFSVTDLLSGPVQNGASVEFVPAVLPDGRLQAKQVRPAHSGAAPRVIAPTKLAPGQARAGQVRTGQVKNFKESSGYGFIVCPGVEGDLKFSVGDVVSGPVENGLTVEFVPAVLPDGRKQAKQVRPARGGVAPPASAGASGKGGMLTGQVKNFRETSGYGFIVSPSVTGDLKFSIGDVVSGPVDNGVTVEFVPAVLPDGRKQAKQVSVRGGAPPPPAGGGGAGAGVADGEVLTGQVKNFREASGYGFIVCTGVAGDLKFSVGDVVSGIVENGATVEFVSAVLPDGRLQAKQVCVVQGGAGPPEGLGALADGEVRTGQVKNFRETSGYGFIVCTGVPGDLKFTVGDVVSGLIENGATVECVPAVLPDGRLQAKQVCVIAGGVQPPAVLGALADGEVHTGQVKNFRESSGYGFIVCPDVPGDLKFTIGDVVSGPVDNGSAVEFVATVLPDGRLQAKQVCAVPGGAALPGSIGPPADGEDVRTGMVKNFREMSGYGFITCPDVQGDLRFTTADIVSSRVENGCAVDFIPVVLPDGRLQAKQVCAVQDGGLKRPAEVMDDGAWSYEDSVAAKRPATGAGTAMAGGAGPTGL